MSEVVTVKLSPNRSNIMYVERRTDLETDFSESLSTLKEKQKDTLRVVVYCRTLMIYADLFSRFSYEMGKSQYYPPSAPELGENRLFGMCHASTPQHRVDTIIHYGAPSSIEDYFQASGEEGEVEIQLTP